MPRRSMPQGLAKFDFEKRSAQDRERVLAALEVSRETVERLDVYVALLLKWQTTINLISPSTLDRLWTRHILDSAQILSVGADHRNWADIGSGAGFPGLIMAILSLERAEPSVFHLIEGDQRKASFLREAKRVTEAPVLVHAERAEKLLPGLNGKVSAVTARALAPLPLLLALAEPLLTTGAEGFFPKGESLESEIEQAKKLFAFESQVTPSRTDEKGRILVVRDLRRRQAAIGELGDRK